jgi:hypothetical protein
MDDGGLASTANRYGLHLHTQGFTVSEVDTLVVLLQSKFGIDC